MKNKKVFEELVQVLRELPPDQLAEWEQRLDLQLSVWEIRNLRGIFYRYHDDQHIGQKRRELYADEHPGIDMEAIRRARLLPVVDSLEGNTLIHPLLTPVIQVNRENDKARAVFTSFGYEALSIHREPPMAIWSMGYIPGGHLRQHGEWRILYGEWQRTVKADREKGWVSDMQRSNCRPPLTQEEDRKYLGQYAYRKEEPRKPVPAYPVENTWDAYPDEMDTAWIRRNLKDRREDGV